MSKFVKFLVVFVALLFLLITIRSAVATNLISCIQRAPNSSIPCDNGETFTSDTGRYETPGGFHWTEPMQAYDDNMATWAYTDGYTFTQYFFMNYTLPLRAVSASIFASTPVKNVTMAVPSSCLFSYGWNNLINNASTTTKVNGTVNFSTSLTRGRLWLQYIYDKDTFNQPPCYLYGLTRLYCSDGVSNQIVINETMFNRCTSDDGLNLAEFYVNYTVSNETNPAVDGGYYVLMINDTGSWRNTTFHAWSEPATVVKSVANVFDSRGKYVCGKFWYNNSAGIEKVTSNTCFLVNNTAPTKPTALAVDLSADNSSMNASASGSIEPDEDSITYYYAFYNGSDVRQDYSSNSTYYLKANDSYANITVKTKAFDGAAYSDEFEQNFSINFSTVSFELGISVSNNGSGLQQNQRVRWTINVTSSNPLFIINLNDTNIITDAYGVFAYNLVGKYAYFDAGVQNSPGTQVCANFYANDTSGNIIPSNYSCFNVTAASPGQGGVVVIGGGGGAPPVYPGSERNITFTILPSDFTDVWARANRTFNVNVLVTSTTGVNGTFRVLIDDGCDSFVSFKGDEGGYAINTPIILNAFDSKLLTFSFSTPPTLPEQCSANLDFVSGTNFARQLEIRVFNTPFTNFLSDLWRLIRYPIVFSRDVVNIDFLGESALLLLPSEWDLEIPFMGFLLFLLIFFVVRYIYRRYVEYFRTEDGRSALFGVSFVTAIIVYAFLVFQVKIGVPVLNRGLLLAGIIFFALITSFITKKKSY